MRVEMEKEEQKWEKPGVEGQEEEEESTMVLRKLRNGDEGKITEFFAAVDDDGDGEVSDGGASESNGYAENGAKNENLFINPEIEQKKIEELEEAINGEHKKENLVSFDKTEGVDSTSTKFEEKQIVKNPGPEKLDISSSPDFVVQNNSNTAINNKYEDDLENDIYSSSNHQPFQVSSLEGSISDDKSSKEIEESAEVDLTDDDDDLDVKELDVESVIQKQKTHDLFCPNCNSCITRKVILRKRKRRIRISGEEVKRNKTENVVGSVLEEGSVQSHGDNVHRTDVVDDNDAQISTVDEGERERGPDIFRCLSCFSFFIPTGNGFKMFRSFGDKNGKEKTDNEQAPPSVKRNWFTSMFASNKPEAALEQGSGFQIDVREVNVRMMSSSNLGDQIGQQSFSQNAPWHAPSSEGLVGTAGNNDTLVDGGGTSSEASTDKEAIQLSVPVSELKSSDVDGNFKISVSIPHQEQDVRATILTESVLEDKYKYANFSSSIWGHVQPTELSQHIISKTEIEVHSGQPLKVDDISVLKGDPFPQGKDTVINIDPQQAELSQTVQQDITRLSETASLLQSSAQSNVAGRERTGERKIEVIKSIVYGGLAESITSLSVVASAAGGGAGTLNILALGMANLIGGLIIICHNLWELKCDHRIEQVTNQISDQVTEQIDRYKEVLGRRQNFILHAIVSVISYFVFGLVPPVVYGFSFRKTDDKQLKLVVVAAASLLCIVVLAICRAHVRRPPKPYLKSVASFVVLGLMVSGVSYAAGELVERLLEKLGLFETSSISSLFANEMMRPTESAWASY